MIKKALVLLLPVLVPIFSIGQVTQPERFEMVVDNNHECRLISAGEDGLFILKDLENDDQGNSVVEITLLDTSFDIQWIRRYALNKDFGYIDYHYYDGRVYVLFNNFDVKNRNLELVSWDLAGNVFHSPIRNYIPFSYFDFKATKNAVMVSGYFNYRPVVILYNMTDGVPRVLPGLFNDKSKLIEIQINTNDTFDVLLSGRTIDKRNTMFFNTFDINGSLVKRIILDSDKTHNLLFGRSQAMEENSQIVAGVYGRFNTEYSRGIFVTNVNQYGEQKVKYYNYAEFKNFFSYMKARREQRVKDRIERRKIKDKKIKFNYRLRVHDLIDNGDDYILLGEAFYPKYRNASPVTGANFFNPSWSGNGGGAASGMMFEGYRYTHAVVMGFNKNGDLLWDNSFEINDILSFELEQFVHAATSGDKIALLYVFDNQIRYKIVQKNDVLEGKEQLDIKLMYEGDRSPEGSTNILGLEKWFDNTFYTYGTQRVVNIQADIQNVHREVFFINKLVYK
ncbi:hypothetical protein FNH22_17110 [Fulvivirga sp. M361]|uniref:hypothetical protein n=1 Tax=Fulvivirga sp. M361 TaxID=2594266 RepID=UPI00117B6F85|nr:hypothetical protein [Fulvivirga sp. M361]TRX56098.1 hypothetical protein FNH22_17110 [Fulvivirga sp. M361]